MKINPSGLMVAFATLTALSCDAQDLRFFVHEFTCERNSQPSQYLEFDKTEHIYLDGNWNSINNDSIKSYKLKSKNFDISGSHGSYFVTPKTLGTATLVAKVKLVNGKKVNVSQEFDIVELPEIEVSISVTSPDSKFMWLSISDKKTGLLISEHDYDICVLDFELTDSSGKTKESGVYMEKNDFFPSVTLTELPSKFELNDRLRLGISLVHKKYGLVVWNGDQLITITKLWN